MTYSEIINELTFGWLDAMQNYDKAIKTNSYEYMKKWHNFLDPVRMDLHNAIEDLVENSKLYRDKNAKN